MITCISPTIDITNIDLAGGNDLSAQLIIRYKLASDPDSAYVVVTTIQDVFGITIPFLDTSTLDPGTYIVHTYFTTDGDTTGTKVTIVVGCDDLV